MHYMLIATLHIVLCDVYINVHMVIIKPSNELLRYLMKYDDISVLNDIYFSPKRLLLGYIHCEIVT